MRKLDLGDIRYEENENEVDQANARKVLERHSNIFRGNPNILGFGVSMMGEVPYIQLLIKQKTGNKMSKTIPDNINGIKIYYIETDDVRPL